MEICLDNIVERFNLNSEQECAFCTVANHTLSETERLSMYLGGMGETGKSQVIKALMTFLEECNEEIALHFLMGSEAQVWLNWPRQSC